MTEMQTASNYTFSGAKLETLGSTEYTLATLIVDVSGSVSSYKTELENAMQTVLDACKKFPRSESIMLRATTFDDNITELHGFQALNDVLPTNIVTRGSTALYDATLEGIEATQQYAKVLDSQDFATNGIIFIITDGGDNASRFKPKDVKKAIDNIKSKELMVDIKVILIGVNDSGCSQYLDKFKNEANLDDYVSIGQATPASLAKLAKFISRSISSSSQTLATKSPSQLLTF